MRTAWSRAIKVGATGADRAYLGDDWVWDGRYSKALAALAPTSHHSLLDRELYDRGSAGRPVSHFGSAPPYTDSTRFRKAPVLGATEMFQTSDASGAYNADTLSVSFLFKANGLVAANAILAARGTNGGAFSSRQFMAWFSSNGSVTGRYFQSTAARTIISAAGVADTTSSAWHHYVLQHEPGRSRLWVNGSIVASDTQAGGINSTGTSGNGGTDNHRLTWGGILASAGSAGDPYVGPFAHGAIWAGRFLTSAEIAALYAATS